MNDTDGLIDKIDRELGSNAPATQEENIAYIRERLDLELKLLRGGKSHFLDRPEWWLVLDAFEHLIFLLRQGEATSDIQRMAANFLEQQVSEGEGRSAYAILGLHAPNGRPKKSSLNELRAVVEYEERLNEGASQADAERAAWETLYPLEEYDLLAVRAVDSEDKNFKNEAERRMVNMVRPLLRRAGVMKRQPAGRPRGSKSKSKP